MKIGINDNVVLLYLDGTEDLDALKEYLTHLKTDLLPARKIADELYRANTVPTVNPAIQKETDADVSLVPDHTLRRYREILAEFHREYIRERR